MLRIYSFGPSGAGRMQTPSGTTIFPPSAPVDVVKGVSYELVRARPVISGQPTLLARFGRYFQVDEREAPYPPPAPPCNVRFLTEWTPDDGSDQTKSEDTSSATYLGPGQTLWTTALDSEWIFEVDRPGRLYIVYLLYVSSDWISLGHGVHFVNDPTAPLGAELLPAQFYKNRQRRNFSERSGPKHHDDEDQG
jgi:hypothetical protein